METNEMTGNATVAIGTDVYRDESSPWLFQEAVHHDVFEVSSEVFNLPGVKLVLVDNERSDEQAQEPAIPYDNIYQWLNTILPKYDFASIAQRADAIYSLIRLRDAAQERIEVFGTSPDVEGAGNTQSEISEVLALGQMESMASRDDNSE
jgi:hypothetical protein